jgi:hypothetical protein
VDAAHSKGTGPRGEWLNHRIVGIRVRFLWTKPAYTIRGIPLIDPPVQVIAGSEELGGMNAA